MGNVSPTLVKEKKPQKFENVLDEKSPQLPRNREKVEHANGFNGVSFARVVFNLSTNIVGAGIMALPATMNVLRLIVGIAMIFFVAFLTGASIELLLNFSKTGKLVTYGQVMGNAFGRTRRLVLQIFIVVNNVGVQIVYMIIIGTNINISLYDSMVCIILMLFGITFGFQGYTPLFPRIFDQKAAALPPASYCQAHHAREMPLAPTS